MIAMPAIEARLAWDMVMNCHSISPRVGLCVWSHILNVTSHLMPKNRRSHAQTVKLLQIRSADSACPHFDENLSSTNLWQVKIGKYESSLKINESGFQENGLSALPTDVVSPQLS